MILVFYLIQQSFVQIYIHHLEKQLVVKKILATQKKVLIKIDFRNRHEAIRESLEDIKEGADIVMVKPACFILT